MVTRFKNIVFAFLGNFVGGGIFVGLVYAFLNGKAQSFRATIIVRYEVIKVA